MIVKDSYNRAFSYLRLSITDVCNFHCSHYSPDGYECISKDKVLCFIYQG